MARVANDRKSSILPPSSGPHGEKRFAALSFVATCMSVFAVYLFGWQPDGEWLTLGAVLRSVWFTVSLMSILFAHEMGHYMAAKYSGFRLSMPMFIPFPFFVGTLGALIQMREAPKTRRSLMVMGAAGPLAGLLMLSLLMWMRIHYGVGVVDLNTSALDLSLSQPLVWRVLNGLSGGPILHVSPYDPVAFGAWIGCLVTAMNLLPFGQLDGGHIVRSYFHESYKRSNNIVTVLLVICGFWWMGWIVWAIILRLVRADQFMELSDKTDTGLLENVVGLAAVLCFCLCFTLTPF